jgi:hypothetical protein
MDVFLAGSTSEYAFPADLSVEDRKLVKTTAEKFGLSTKSFGMGSERRIHIFKPKASTEAALEAVKYSVKNTFVDGPVDPTAPSPALVGPAHQSMPVGELQAQLAAEELEAPTDLSSTLVEKLNTKLNKTEESPRNSQSGDSTVDSESEKQEDPSDPTICIKNSFVHFENDSDENGDPRIIQSMPNGKFAESIEAEKSEASTKRTRKPKAKPLPFSEDPEVSEAAAMVFPATPNAEMSYDALGPHCATPPAASASQTAPVVQWAPSNTAQQDSSVAVLPPANWTPSASSQLLPENAAKLQDSITASPDSITVLPPAVWNPQAAAQNGVNGGGLMPQVPAQGIPGGSPPQMAPQGPPPCFVPGTPVVLCGLASQPTFNGLRGTVAAFDPECGRFNIIVEIGANATRRMVKVKFENLVHAPSTQPTAALPPVLPPQPLPPQPVVHQVLPPQQPVYPYAPQPVSVNRPAKATLSLDAMI